MWQATLHDYARGWSLQVVALKAAADIGNMPQPRATQQRSVKMFVEWLCVRGSKSGCVSRPVNHYGYV